MTKGDSSIHDYPEGWGSMFLRNISNHLLVYRVNNIPSRIRTLIKWCPYIPHTVRGIIIQKTTINMRNPREARISYKLLVDKLIKKFLRWPLILLRVTYEWWICGSHTGVFIFWEVTPCSLVGHRRMAECTASIFGVAKPSNWQNSISCLDYSSTLKIDEGEELVPNYTESHLRRYYSISA